METIEYLVRLSPEMRKNNNKKQLSSIRVFLKNLESLDKVMLQSFSFQYNWRFQMLDMEPHFFLYKIIIQPEFTGQGELGKVPDSSKIALWMQAIREDILLLFNPQELDTANLSQKWHDLAKTLGISQSLFYMPLTAESILSLLDNRLKLAWAALGKGTVVCFE